MINRLLIVWIALLFTQAVDASSVNKVPKELLSFIKSIDINTVHGAKPKVSFKNLSKNLVYVSVVWQLEHPATQDSVAIKIRPAFTPGFHWAPHLTPNPNSIIAQHVFRAPAMLVSDTQKLLVVIPDLDLLKKTNPVPWYMDMNAPQNYLELGMSKSRVEEQVW